MSNIPIFLSSDDNYAPFVATTIASICDNTKSFCEFYVLDGGIREENKGKLCELKNQFDNFSIEFIKINVEKEFRNIEYVNAEKRITLSTYNRFLIPKIKPELKKVLYLDVDIVVLGDIEELFDEPLDEYSLGAVWNSSRKNFNTDTKELLELSPDYKYFNAGVLLVNSKKWREQDVIMQIFNLEKKYRGKILHADETLLNKLFDNDYKILPLKYNYLDFDTFNNKQGCVVIRHFATNVKPWDIHPELVTTGLMDNYQDFWRYASKTPFYNQILEHAQKKKTEETIRQLRIQNMILKAKSKNV